MTPQNLNDLLGILWKDYTSLNPQVKAVHDLFTQEKEVVLNDHVAFRTLAHPSIGLSAMEKIFLELGYKQSGDYHFKEKKLYAKHYEHSDKTAPKIFISELKISECSTYLQDWAKNLITQIPDEQKKSPILCTSGRKWEANFQIYEKLKLESEYAAWFYAFGFRVNHFTVLVNALKKFTTLQSVNTFLKNHNIALNTSGGEIKGTPHELLEQSSTLAYNAKVQFTDGIKEIPACYYEFAKRYVDSKGNLYSGFIAKSADKIFESTNKGQ